ncbi:hypothetical protein FOL47_002144 [Perkinsus chesapeaki]|uniref:TRUD domain-containing protein n=1 Tax=Perkinsus chesapeaki TaxID=330153 RepID=A0A7J6MF38_PERCH|nr:hypothetical protein FOL47_002144 [Perkinsus chesapeaki]
MSSSEASTPSHSPTPTSPLSSPAVLSKQSASNTDSPTKEHQQQPGAPPVYLVSMSLNQDHTGFCLGTTKDFRTFFLYSQAQSDNFVEFRRRLMSAPVAVAVMLYKTNIRALVSAGEPTRVLLWDDKSGTAPHALCSRPEVLNVQMRRDVIAVVTEYKIYVYSLPELDVMLHLDTHGNSVSSHLSSHSILGAHNSAVMALQLNVSGTLVASAGESGTVIKVWATEDGQLLHELRRGTTNTLICCLSFRDDDQYLVSSSSSNTVHVFRLASPRHARSGSGDSQGSSSSGSLDLSMSFSSTLLSYAASAVNYVEQQTNTLLQLGAGGGTSDQTGQASTKHSLASTLPIGYFKSARSIAQFHLPDIDPATGRTSVDLRAVSGGLARENIGEGVPIGGPLVCFSKTHPDRIYVFHYNGLRYECEFEDDAFEAALSSGTEVPASTAMRLVQAITFFASRPDFHMENAASKTGPPVDVGEGPWQQLNGERSSLKFLPPGAKIILSANGFDKRLFATAAIPVVEQAAAAAAGSRPRSRWTAHPVDGTTFRSRHSPVADYTVKKPLPEAVGITEFINPLALGGDLRVKIKDWEVREVGTDLKVARLNDEPILHWWEEVEEVVSEEAARNGIDAESGEETSFPPLEEADKTKAVEDAHWEGFNLAVPEARELIEAKLGHSAITRLDSFLDNAAAKTHEAGVLRTKLGEGVMSDEEAYRLRGAIVAATKHVLANVPCQFEGREHRVFHIAENRGFKRLLLQHMTLSDAQMLLGLITCGYGQRDVSFAFRSPGQNVADEVERFAAEVAKFWRDLDFQLLHSATSEDDSTIVRASWSRLYSQRGLHGGKRWRCVLHKANLDTPRVLAILEKELRLPRESIHYAGLKDKRGLTYQYVTIPATHSPEEIKKALSVACGGGSRGWAALDNFQLHDAPEKKFKCGTLFGNCFRIRLRDVEPGASAKLDSLRNTGFVNYFGLQRFGWDKGSGESSHVRTGGAIITRDFYGAVQSYLRPLADDFSEDAEIRREWLESGDARKASEALNRVQARDNRDIILYRAMLSELATCRDKGRRAMMLIPRTLWHLLASAYISCLWNRLASRRILHGGGLQVQIGDLVKEPASGELRLIYSLDDAEKFSIHDVRLPQLGEQIEGECRVLGAGLDVEQLYAGLIGDSEDRGEIRPGSWPKAQFRFSDLGFHQKLTTVPRRLIVRPTVLLAAEESNGERLPDRNNLLLDVSSKTRTLSVLARSAGVLQESSLGSLARKLGIERKLTVEERDREQFDRFNQRVGIEEHIDPKGSGGFIRGKMEDWEVREVGMDGKVARMRIEPMRPCWAAVEQLHLEEGEPRSTAVDPRSLQAGEDSTQSLLDAFEQGYTLGDSAASSYISAQCSEDAITKIEQFVKRATGKKSRRDVRGLLCTFHRADPGNDLADVYKIRGAIAWQLRQTFAMIPMKILSHEVMFYGATDAQRSELLIECVHHEDAVELMRFILRGFNDGSLTIRLLRGTNSDLFLRQLTKQFENLEVSVMKKANATPQVLLSWQRKHSPVGLFNAQRWRFVLKKTGWDTNALQRAVEQNLRLPSNSLHYGGTKDRFGVTYQYMTLPTTHDEQRIREAFDDISRGASRMCEAGNFEVNTGPAKLRQGLSLGNCFRVRIRGAEPGVGKRLSSIESQGFINYYGLQRFGINPNHGEERHCNVDIGGAIVSGQYEKAVMKQWSSDGDIAKALQLLGSLDQLDSNAKIWKSVLLLLTKNRGPDRYRIALKGGVPHNVTLLYLSAYQSYLWNQLASQRIRQGGLELMDGDVLLSPVSGEVLLFETNSSADE